MFYSCRSFGRIWPPLQMVTPPFTTFRLPFSSSCWKLYYSAVASLSPPHYPLFVLYPSPGNRPPTHASFHQWPSCNKVRLERPRGGTRDENSGIYRMMRKNLLLSQLFLNEFIFTCSDLRSCQVYGSQSTVSAVSPVSPAVYDFYMHNILRIFGHLDSWC